MKIGISTWSLSGLNIKNGFDLIDKAKEHGFEALDFTLDSYRPIFDWYEKPIEDLKKHFNELSKYAKKEGVIFSQVHTPYALFPDFLTDDYLDITKRAILIAGIIEAPYVVMHPLVFPEYRQRDMIEKEKQYNIKYLTNLIPYLKENNTKIALENIYDWDNDKKIRYIYVSNPEGLANYLTHLPKEYFVICLDTGHLHMAGYTMDDAVKHWGENLKVLHLNDNNGVLDDHFAPLMGTFDWTDFIKKLKKINFEGVLSLEIKPFSYFNKLEKGFMIAKSLTELLD